MVEDPEPDVYDPVALSDAATDDPNVPKIDDETGRPQFRSISSSVRSIYRTLYNVSGWTSLFRGLGCFVAFEWSVLFVMGLLSSLLPLPALIAAPITAVLTVQLHTAWVHIVISAPSNKSFWQRLPPFKQTCKAVALPVSLFLFAWEFTSFVPRLLAYKVLDLPRWNPTDPSVVPTFDGNVVWKMALVLLLATVMKIFIVVPSHVVLVRIQASLLPEEDETIVPFDRAFQGFLEPAVVGGNGFVSIKDAWKTFTRASWIRLIKLYVKVGLIGCAIGLLFLAVIAPQAALIMKLSKSVQ